VGTARLRITQKPPAHGKTSHPRGRPAAENSAAAVFQA